MENVGETGHRRDADVVAIGAGSVGTVLSTDVPRDVQFVTWGKGHMIVNVEGALILSEPMLCISGEPHWGSRTKLRATVAPAPYERNDWRRDLSADPAPAA